MADVFGTAYDDFLSGSEERDFISGADGNDILQGGASFDTIYGDAGHDVIDGGESADVLNGGTGSDTIVGAHGNDTLYGDGDIDDDILDQTASTSTTIPTTGQTIAISLTAPEESADSNFNISGFVSTSEINPENVNIAVVLDVSGSTSYGYSGTSVGDLNNDGLFDTFLDAEIAGALALIDSIVNDANLPNANIAIIPFHTSATTLISTTATADSNNDGVSDLEDALRSLTPIDATYYDVALQETLTYFSGQPDGTNYVYFLSDGLPNGGDYSDESELLRDPNGLNATIVGFPVGTNASAHDIDLLDDGLDNNSAPTISDPGNLSADITTSGVLPEDIREVQVYVNGDLYAVIPSDDLTETPLGLRYELNLTGLSEEDAETVEVVAVATDEFSTTVAAEVTVGVADVAGDDVLIGGEGSDDIFAGAGDDVAIGGGADDFIKGEGGNDTLLADEGDDTVDGGAGSDMISGDFGEDILSGQTGDDIVKGGLGDDSISGGKGDDTLNGGNGVDTLEGGEGNDLMRGAGGEDILNGGSGNDLIYGGSKNDELNGNAGYDILNGGSGRDLLTGGKGYDDFVFEMGSGRDTITDMDTAEADHILLDIGYQLTSESAFDLASSVVVYNGAGLLLDFGANELQVDGVFDIADLDGFIFYG